MEPTMKAFVASTFEAACYRILILEAQACLRENLPEGAKLALAAVEDVPTRAKAYADNEEAKEAEEQAGRVHLIFEPILEAIQQPPKSILDRIAEAPTIGAKIVAALDIDRDEVGRPAIIDAESAE
jgi:hypothetical protein